jgi:hypothetical protein
VWLFFNLARSSDFGSFTLTIGCAFAKTSLQEEIKHAQSVLPCLTGRIFSD